MSDDRKPFGPKDQVCPFHRKAMAKVCHTCPAWQHVWGTIPIKEHPGDLGQHISKWACTALEYSHMFQIQTGKEVAALTKEVEELKKSINVGNTEVIMAVRDMALAARQVGAAITTARKEFLREVDKARKAENGLAHVEPQALPDRSENRR
jgi:hypothetical protein